MWNNHHKSKYFTEFVIVLNFQILLKLSLSIGIPKEIFVFLCFWEWIYKKNEREKEKKKRKRKRKRKEYNSVTLLVELSQETPVLNCLSHKSLIPIQFKFCTESNELYQFIKICWSLGSIELSPIP